jgi:hypothetical protein
MSFTGFIILCHNISVPDPELSVTHGYGSITDTDRILIATLKNEFAELKTLGSITSTKLEPDIQLKE